MLELAFDAAGERLVVRKQERGPTSTVSVYQWRPQALLHEVANRLDANMGQRTWEELLPGVQFPTTFSELPISFEIAVNGVAISEGPILPILPKWTIGTFFCGMFVH